MRSTLLRRGRFVRHTRARDPGSGWPHDQWIRRAFSLPDYANPDAYEALEYGAADDIDRALVARPVHLHVGLDHLMLLPPHALSLTRAAAEALGEAANLHFEAGEPTIDVLAPGCWLLRGTSPWSVRAHTASLAVGRDVRGFLPTGDDARRLATWVNELQMLWHAHPVNELREAEGHLPVNGLWIEGSLPSPGGCRFEAVHSDHAGIRALARAAGVRRVSTAPRAAAELCELFGAEEVLVELSMWRRPLLDRDTASWRDAWEAFGDLVAGALRKAPLGTRLRFVLTGEHETVTLDWSAADRWKWWRGIDHGPGPAVEE